MLAEHFERGGDRRARGRCCIARAAEQALAACDFAGASRAPSGVACGARRRGARRAAAGAGRGARWRGEFAAAARAGARRWRCCRAARRRGSRPRTRPPRRAASSATSPALERGRQALLRAAPTRSRDARRARHRDRERRVPAVQHGSHALAQALLDVVELVAPAVDEPAHPRADLSGAVVALDVHRRRRRVPRVRARGRSRRSSARATCATRACSAATSATRASRSARIAEAERSAARRARPGDAARARRTSSRPSKHNLGRALAARGELAEALRVEAEAVAAFDAQGDRRLAGRRAAVPRRDPCAQGELARRRSARCALALAQLAAADAGADARDARARSSLASGRVVEALDRGARGA